MDSADPLQVHSRIRIYKRVTAYLDRTPVAIEGRGGDKHTFTIACTLIHGFGLTVDESYWLCQNWNKRCEPPWQDQELKHKLTEADKRQDSLGRQRGYLLRDGLPEHPLVQVIVDECRRQFNESKSDGATSELVSSATNYEINEVPNSSDSSTSWPSLDEDAYFGIAGDFVKFVAPHTEADPAAILLQLLTTCGCYLGRERYFSVEATQHHPNLFCAIVGHTAKARKGTSWSWVRSLFELIDLTWTNHNIKSGSVSGEGLIYNVRDSLNKDDPGITDKRMLINEEEFSSILKVGKRDSNTLTDVMRRLWDGTNVLETMAKNNPVKTTNAHVSIVGHITLSELQLLLCNTDIYNGFVNRFIWFVVKRSKLLPNGGNIRKDDLQPFADQFKAAFQSSPIASDIKRNKEACELWNDVYEELSTSRFGALGAVTARSEAQVTRLALIYALLDRSSVIQLSHLRAAIAIWNYSFESAKMLFGNSSGHKLVDRILALVKQCGNSGITRTELSVALNRNKTAKELDAVIEYLKRERMIEQKSEQRGTCYYIIEME